MPSRVPLLRPKSGIRLLALLVDYAVILGWMATLALVTVILTAITGEMFNWLELGTAGAQLLGFLLLVLPVGVYLFLGESSSRQATLGKRALGLRVVDARNGDRPSRPRILVRTIVKLLPWEIAHFAVWHTIAIVAEGGSEFPAWLMIVLVAADVLPLVYVAFVLFQKDRRGPHDLIAGTRVVRGEIFTSGETGIPVI
ncbi:RDD family protein [Microbacterium sp. ISL-59]|uniref:RDD family protein n=1 Tax=Microbacterium sp. ISL-59 TaxID=2819159 RepID=UPI001BE5609E|nr:RDD family protein [Microbacterium sp. ISL-59]MBT2496011.1 RDD family protein [Microbacterium sp. ISL-59]